jgi:hypothetical protein
LRYLPPDVVDPSRVLSIAYRRHWYTDKCWGFYIKLRWWQPFEVRCGLLHFNFGIMGVAE